jgi:hypothetical protein
VTSSIAIAPIVGRNPRKTDVPRNRAAEALLGPARWDQNITAQARQIIKAALGASNASVFERAHRVEPFDGPNKLYVYCAFHNEAQAKWFVDAFNSVRVDEYETVWAYPATHPN